MACERTPLDWSQSQLLLLEDLNIHIDNTIKPVEEEEDEEEDEDEEDEEEEEEEDDDWETEDEDEDFMELYEEDESESMLPSPKRSLPDVEGAIPKTILRKLPNSTIRKIIFHVKKNILMLETENYLYEKTIDKLEASEREINSRIPAGQDEEFEEHLKKARVRICSSESEDEEPLNDGNYKAIDAVDEIRVSQDSFFENMSDNSKEEAIGFFRAIGSMAPPNYDVMHHKYGDYVGTAAEKQDFVGEPGVKTRLNTQILQSRMQLDEKMITATAMVKQEEKEKEKGGAGKDSNLDIRGSDSAESAGATEEEDFNLADAKKLSITDRLRFATEEEEEFIKRFYQHETQALKDESAIQVHIDAHKHALGILMGIRKDFRQIAKGATGAGMNGKVMADLLVKFRLRMRNQLSIEETRTRISIRKVISQKKRILEQLKINKEVGRGISQIDYEYMLCESSILESEIHGMNNTLQHLKDLTAQFHLVLQDERQMMDKMVVQEGKMNKELKRRHDLLRHFHQAYIKYQHQISEANLRMEMIKKRISETVQVPQPLDYIRLKASQFELEAEVQSMENKLEQVTSDLTKAQKKFEKYKKCLPAGAKSIEEENEAWLEEIKKELQESNIDDDSFEESVVKQPRNPKVRLMETIVEHEPEPEPETDDDEDSWNDETEGLGAKVMAGLSKNRLTMSARASMRLKVKTSLPTLPTILAQPRRFDTMKSLHRKSKMPIYDLDFDLDQQALRDLDTSESKEKHSIASEKTDDI